MTNPSPSRYGVAVAVYLLSKGKAAIIFSARKKGRNDRVKGAFYRLLYLPLAPAMARSAWSGFSFRARCCAKRKSRWDRFSTGSTGNFAKRYRARGLIKLSRSSPSCAPNRTLHQSRRSLRGEAGGMKVRGPAPLTANRTNLIQGRAS